MINESTFAQDEQTGRTNNYRRLRSFLEILVASLPILVLGITGTIMGTANDCSGGVPVSMGRPAFSGCSTMSQIVSKTWRLSFANCGSSLARAYSARAMA